MPGRANLWATPIIDHGDARIRDLASRLREEFPDDRKLLQSAHGYLVDSVKPIYSLQELQSASHTLLKRRGSCSQRTACLEAIARACNVPTRARALRISGKFWYPRFRFFRVFIPKSILLVWPQLFLEGNWVDFDELYGSLLDLAKQTEHGFTNDGESIFDAVNHLPVDFLAKTCAVGCACPGLAGCGKTPVSVHQGPSQEPC
jgi:Transglutaminase-like superfamily